MRAQRRIALWRKGFGSTPRVLLKTVMAGDSHRGFECHALRRVVSRVIVDS